MRSFCAHQMRNILKISKLTLLLLSTVHFWDPLFYGLSNTTGRFLKTPCMLRSYMGYFPQDGENEQNLSEIFCFWSFTVTKRFDFFKFSQLFWRDYVRGSLKILSFTLQKIFGVPCSTPVFAILIDFCVKIRALVRPNRQRWTGFDLLIISGVKFWWFSFFLEPL